MEILDLPKNPGVYLFKNKFDEIIYVGKAKNIKKRVKSYFRGKNHTIKTQFLVKNIDDLDYIVVDNEIEALLLENKLIKKHRPKYNIDLKDGKTYAYIGFTKERYPRIFSTRKTSNNGKFFGPYTDGSVRHQLIQLAIKLFKLRTCKNLPKKACLNYYIGLCSAPCIDKVNEEEYNLQVKDAIGFLKGNNKKIIKRLENEMKEFSKELKFEKAIERKKQIEAILYLEERQKVDLVKKFDQDVLAIESNGKKCVIEMFSISRGVISGKSEFRFDDQENIFEEFLKMYYSKNYIPKEIIINKKIKDIDAIVGYLSKIKGSQVIVTKPKKGQKLELVRLAQKNATLVMENSVLIEIQEKLNLAEIPNIIECFDISNLGVEHYVGGMVQFRGAVPYKSGYRKFKIRSFKDKQDDFRAIREVIFRRYRKLRDENREFPHLIVVDGGIGQLNAALDSLKKLGVKIPIIGLAKKREEIFVPGKLRPLKFNKNSKMMLLIRRIRDEVHRYVLAYNKKRRKMKLNGR